MYYPNDIYTKRITPEEFLLSLKNHDPKRDVYALDPHKIQTDWVNKPDVIALSKYLGDSTKCSEVVNVSFVSTFQDSDKSAVNKEALKLINIYFTKEYLNFSSENYYSKEKVLEWVKANN
ncbi:hypothetical protein D3C71_899850 [compost metagenome]